MCGVVHFCCCFGLTRRRVLFILFAMVLRKVYCTRCRAGMLWQYSRPSGARLLDPDLSGCHLGFIAALLPLW